VKKEKWILLLSFFFADDVGTQAARGMFLSEAHCLRFRASIAMSIEESWVGHCMTEAEFRLRYPSMALESGS
jgi:hypothetical protein